MTPSMQIIRTISRLSTRIIKYFKIPKESDSSCLDDFNPEEPLQSPMYL